MIAFARQQEKPDPKAFARYNNWRRLQWCCYVHRHHTAVGRVYDLLSVHISGMIALALALTNGCNFSKLKSSFSWLLSKRLNYYGDHVSPIAEDDDRLAYREAVLNRCIPVPEKGDTGMSVEWALKRRRIYKELFKGNITAKSVIEHHCDGVADQKWNVQKSFTNTDRLFSYQQHRKCFHFTGGQEPARSLE